MDLLWADLKPMLADICKAAVWGVLNPADVEGIDDYIHQLSELDPDSYSFRYARSKKGDRSLPPDVKRINLRHFAETIERLADYLDGLDAATVDLEEVKAEMEVEYGREMAHYMDYAERRNHPAPVRAWAPGADRRAGERAAWRFLEWDEELRFRRNR